MEIYLLRKGIRDWLRMISTLIFRPGVESQIPIILRDEIKNSQILKFLTEKERRNIKVYMNMKKKIFMLLVMVMTVVTASAEDAPTYSLSAVESGGRGTISIMVDESPVTSAAEGADVTVTVTPPTGFSVGSVAGEWNAAIAKTRNSGSDIGMKKDFELTLVSEVPATGTKTYTFKMIRANAVISIKYAKIIQDSWIQDIAAVTYNGSAQKPTVVIKDGDYTLALGTDYTVSYSNNINARTASATNAPTATVTGIGNYSGTASKTFTINKANGNVLFSPYRFTKTFGDPDFTIRPSVTGDGTLKYESNKETVATVNSTTGKVSIKGIGTVRITARLSTSTNYTSASDWYEVTVNPKQVTITIGPNGMATYCGAEPLDFTGNEELTVYTVIGCSYGSNTIWLSRVYDVPAGTPILIKGAEGTYTLDCATSSDSYFKNKLVGNLSGSTMRIEETDGALRNYYLKGGTFLKVNGYANIADGKAYLQLPASAAEKKAGSAVDITLSSTGKSTLCSDVDLDFSGFEDNLKAYVVTGYDIPTKTFWLNRVVEASAGTPLYLVGKANTTYSIPSKGVQTSFENMLVGNLSGSTIQVVEMSEDGTMRNLYLKDGTFKKVNNYVNIVNGKCYLQAPSDIVAAMARGMEDPDFNLIVNDELMSMSFSDFEEDVTGVKEVKEVKEVKDNSFYDLSGRKLNGKPTRSGVYVNNGRKVVLK